ncbi:MAG: GNAT family N-acetyltransferase [Pseudomonadota bacterium]
MKPECVILNPPLKMMTKTMNWIWKNYNDLSVAEFYPCLRLRSAVFVVEQNCVYEDLDDYDAVAHHCWLLQNQGVAAYLRMIPAAHHASGLPALGRIVVDAGYRDQGLGRKLVLEGLRYIKSVTTAPSVFISAQHHLQGFYGSLGFQASSKPYDEDGILHIDMIQTY